MLAGNSLMESIRAFGQVLGPGQGGWLIAIAGAATVVLVQAVTFAASAVSLGLIRAHEPIVARPADRPRLRVQINEGLRFVAHHRILRAIAFTSSVTNVGFGIASAVTFIFLSENLGLDATAIGVVLALGSVTVMIGAAATPRLARRIGSARIIWLAPVVTAPITFLGPLAGRGWGVALIVVGMAAGELGQIIYSITNVSLRQRVCPERMLGRVNATMRFAVLGVFPLGALVGGLLGNTMGVRATLWFAVGVMGVATVPALVALRKIRDVEQVRMEDPRQVPPGARPRSLRH